MRVLLAMLIAGLAPLALGQATSGNILLSGSSTGAMVNIASPPPGTTMAIEKLSPKELTALKEAQANLDQAQSEFDAISESIKYAHGKSSDTSVARFCANSATSVTFWGEYALIETYPLPSCVSW